MPTLNNATTPTTIVANAIAKVTGRKPSPAVKAETAVPVPNVAAMPVATATTADVVLVKNGTRTAAGRSRKAVDSKAKAATKATKANERRASKQADAKADVTAPKHRHPKGAQPGVRAEGHGVCPVTGNPTAKGKVFTGFGNDAKAKMVVNGLLLEKENRKHRIALIDLDTFHNQDAVRKVVAAARKAGVEKIDKPTEWFSPVVNA